MLFAIIGLLNHRISVILMLLRVDRTTQTNIFRQKSITTTTAA